MQKTVYLLIAFFIAVGCGQNEDTIDEITFEKYTEKPLAAPSCDELKGVEYDGTWDPASSRFTGFLKTCKNGKVYDYCEFKEGKRHGEYLTYDDAGLLMGLTEYQDGAKHGDFVQLDKQGNIVLRGVYENDILVSCEGPLCDLL